MCVCACTASRSSSPSPWCPFLLTNFLYMCAISATMRGSLLCIILLSGGIKRSSIRSVCMHMYIKAYTHTHTHT